MMKTIKMAAIVAMKIVIATVAMKIVIATVVMKILIVAMGTAKNTRQQDACL